MADTVSFKVFLTKDDDPEAKPEVRRFGIDKDVVNNFLYFNEKLQTVFSGLRSKQFTISWKDADGDDVVISSDEELKIALSETSDHDIRKLYIRLRSDYPEAPFPGGEESSQTLHIGVTCDGCEKEVQGFRYKCIQCVDYDLCADCEAKGLHPEHCMIRSAVPMQWGSHFGRRLVHHMNRFAKKSGHCGKDKETAPGESQCPYKRGRYNHGGPGGPGHHGGHRGPRPERPSWLNAFSTYLNDWTNLAEDEDCPMKETNGKDGSGEKQRSDPNPHAELFKNIGENLSSLLDPLGIDVEVRAEPEPDNSGSKTKSNAGPSASGSKFPGEGKKLVEKKPAENAEQTADRPGIGFENEGWTLLNQQDAGASAPSPPSNSNGAIPKPTTPSVPADSVPASAPPTNPIYPLLPQQTETPSSVIYHPDPKIQRAIIAMMQMGFSNDGGWLTQLLASKNGDISKVLDILQPVRPGASEKQ